MASTAAELTAEIRPGGMTVEQATAFLDSLNAALGRIAEIERHSGLPCDGDSQLRKTKQSVLEAIQAICTLQVNLPPERN